MNEVEQLDADLRSGFLDELHKALKDREKEVATALKEHFATVRKKQGVEDLDERVANMGKSIDQLVPFLKCGWRKDELVVTAAGAGDATWTLLLIGGDWFDPSPELGQVVLAALRV